MADDTENYSVAELKKANGLVDELEGEGEEEGLNLSKRSGVLGAAATAANFIPGSQVISGALASGLTYAADEASIDEKLAFLIQQPQVQAAMRAQGIEEFTVENFLAMEGINAARGQLEEKATDKTGSVVAGVVGTVVGGVGGRAVLGTVGALGGGLLGAQVATQLHKDEFAGEEATNTISLLYDTLRFKRKQMKYDEVEARTLIAAKLGETDQKYFEDQLKLETGQEGLTLEKAVKAYRKLRRQELAGEDAAAPLAEDELAAAYALRNVMNPQADAVIAAAVNPSGNPDRDIGREYASLLNGGKINAVQLIVSPMDQTEAEVPGQLVQLEKEQRMKQLKDAARNLHASGVVMGGDGASAAVPRAIGGRGNSPAIE